MENYQSRTYQKAARYIFRPIAHILAQLISCSQRLTQWAVNRDFFAKHSILIRLRMPSDEVAEVDGIKFHFDFSNPLNRLVYFKHYERNDLMHLLSHTKAGDCCIDIGANFGAYTLYLGQKVGSEGRVFAFEPHPEVFSRLRRNIALNPHMNITALPFALSSSTRKGTMHLHPENTDIGAIDCNSSAAYTKEINLITLDEFIIQEKISKVNLIKMDVEGHELSVLEGAKKTLRNGAVDYILVEFASLYWRSKGINISAFIKRFEDLGYKLIPTDSYNKLRKNRFYDPDKTANLLFTGLTSLSRRL